MATNLWKIDAQKGRIINGCEAEAETDFVIRSQVHPGWITVPDTYTYASSTTFTIPSSPIITPEVGDRIRWQNPSAYRYGYVIGVSGTTLTIAAGSDYSIANAAVNNVAISKAINPEGFPAAFNFTPTLTGFSANPTNTVYRFILVGRVVKMLVRQVTAGTSNSTSFTISLPVTALTLSNHAWVAAGQGVDNGGILVPAIMITFSSGATVATLYTTFAGAGWTAANGKSASFQIDYEI